MKPFRLAVFIVLLVSLIPACTAGFPFGQSTNSLERILQRGKLVIATDQNYPPQSQRIEGETRPPNTKCSPTEFTANQFTGFDIDVAVELAKRLGVEPCFVTPTWEQVIGGNWSDHWDINVGSMTITTGRTDVFYFPQPYSTGPAIFLVQKDDMRFTQPSDLSGKKIGVCSNCAYEDYLHGTLALPGSTINFLVKHPIIVAFRKDTAALEILGQEPIGANQQWYKRLDAVLIDQVDGSKAIQSGMPLKQLGEPVFYGYSAVAIDKKGNRDQIPYVQKVNEIIQRMHSEGILRELSLKYYGIDLTTVASQFDIRSLGQLP